MTPRKKFDVMNLYKVFGIVIIMATMAFCQLRLVDGVFRAVEIPKEMWAVISLMITNTFMTITGVELPRSRAMQHVKGGVVLSLLIMVGVSVYFRIPVGKEWWSAIGTSVAFLYGKSESE